MKKDMRFKAPEANLDMEMSDASLRSREINLEKQSKPQHLKSTMQKVGPSSSMSTAKLPDPPAHPFQRPSLNDSPRTDRFTISMQSPELRSKQSPQFLSPRAESPGVRAAPPPSGRAFAEKYHTNPVLFYFSQDVNVG